MTGPDDITECLAFAVSYFKQKGYMIVLLGYDGMGDWTRLASLAGRDWAGILAILMKLSC